MQCLFVYALFDAPWSERSWIDLFSKEMQNPFADSFRFKNPILDFLKETHPLINFHATLLATSRGAKSWVGYHARTLICVETCWKETRPAGEFHLIFFPLLHLEENQTRFVISGDIDHKILLRKVFQRQQNLLPTSLKVKIVMSRLPDLFQHEGNWESFISYIRIKFLYNARSVLLKKRALSAENRWTNAR